MGETSEGGVVSGVGSISRSVMSTDDTDSLMVVKRLLSTCIQNATLL
jgi:hypothetical protein